VGRPAHRFETVVAMMDKKFIRQYWWCAALFVGFVVFFGFLAWIIDATTPPNVSLQSFGERCSALGGAVRFTELKDRPDLFQCYSPDGQFLGKWYEEHNSMEFVR
jgi:hypothetical protein